MERNDILDVIRIMRVQPEPFTESDAEAMAYRECALCDIFYRLTDRPYDDPEDVLYWYMVEMESYRVILSDHKVNQFDIAADTASYILAMMEYPKED